MDLLSTYVKKFSKLRVDLSKGSPAPHKPILLLSIIDSISHGEITENKIYITPELVARFKDNWHKLVKTNKFTPNFSLPFFHLETSGFWFFITLTGREIILTSSLSIRSFAHLKEVIDYAYFSDELYQLLTNQHTSTILKHTLISTYFPDVGYADKLDSAGLINEVVNQILHEAPASYKLKVNSTDEEEVFIRGGLFKRVIPKVYNFTCAVTGMRLITNREVQMIDACHIIPFTHSHDDTVSNGISLCPNLHRAFDRGLITIDDDYRLVVSNSFSESATDYSIKAYHGKEILLPQERHYCPSLSNLNWHRNNIYKD
jgi:putative restriction endonuclease